MIKFYNIEGSLLDNHESNLNVINISGTFLKDCYMNTGNVQYVISDLSSCFSSTTITFPDNQGQDTELSVEILDIEIDSLSATTFAESYEKCGFFENVCGKNREFDFITYYGAYCESVLSRVRHRLDGNNLTTDPSSSAITSGSSIVFINDTELDLTLFFPDTVSGNGSFHFSIFVRDGDEFNQTPVFVSDDVSFSAVTGGTLYDWGTIDFLSAKNEYVIRTTIEPEYCTPFSQLQGLTFSSDNFVYDYDFGVYNFDNSGYFIMINTPPIPEIEVTDLGVFEGTLFFETLDILIDGQSQFNISNEAVNEIIVVNVNGLTLSEDEFSLDGQILTIVPTLLTTDILTVYYFVGTAGDNLIAEAIVLTTPPVSGTTAGPTDKVFFNTTTGKYEIYLEYDIAETDDVILSINGVTLQNGVEYYKSISIDNRLILEVGLEKLDIITIFYLGLNVNTLFIDSDPETISWSVSSVPDNELGYFEFLVTTSGDTAFSSPIISGITNHVANILNYSEDISISGSVGTEYLLVIRNNEVCDTIGGSLIETKSSSDIFTLIINSNELNSY